MTFKLTNDPEKNPWGIREIPYDKPIVDFVDGLIGLAKRNLSKDYVKGEKDWQVVDFIYRGWKVLYPSYSSQFEAHMKNWRALSKTHGINREKGGAMIQHKFELPQKFYDMFSSIFPKQKWDKKFILQFSRRYGQFQGTDKL